jgi:hypothetical protein
VVTTTSVCTNTLSAAKVTPYGDDIPMPAEAGTFDNVDSSNHVAAPNAIYPGKKRPWSEWGW